MTALLALLGALLALLAAARPAEGAPRARWPDSISAKFVSPTKKTRGSFALANGLDGRAAQRIDMDFGGGDHLCTAFHADGSCTQLTAEGFRYLIFPKARDCCKCCTYAQGSYACGGPLSPGWVTNSSFVGTVVIRGRACYRFEVPGLSADHPNYYLQDAVSGLPCGIDGYNYLHNPSEPANDQYLFVPGSLKTANINPSTFKVPDQCRDARYCGGPVCASGPEQLAPA